MNSLDKLRSEVAGGLRYTHTRANANTGNLLEIASFAYAAIELLTEKGLLEISELDERKKAVAARLVEKFINEGMGLTFLAVLGSDPINNSHTYASSLCYKLRFLFRMIKLCEPLSISMSNC